MRRQTLANAERYVTPELKELEDRLLSASDRRKSVEYALFQALRETMAGYRRRLAAAAANLARLDYWQGLAEAARLSDWTRPELTEDLAVRIRAGRHPVVEAVQGGANFIPNDVTLGDDARLLLITGPNMAGKSTVLRQVALIAILAQIGSFVPARSARLGLSDRIFSRVGASDNLAQGRSTFMVEMMETARILRQATRRSLVILDEIGRGTSTFDGLALAWAVVEDLSRRANGAVRTLFATHYHELTGLEGRIPGVRNFNIAVREFKGDIIFLRRLVPGPADKSYGIEVAKLAGVPRGVVERAREILAELERARAGGTGTSRAVAARQTLLPGLAPERSEPPETGEHPLVAELRSLALDKLTPLAALTLLHDWKERLDSEDTPMTFSRRATLALLLGLCLLAAACGKKTAPVPQRPEDRFSFEKIQSSATNDCVSASFEVQGASRFLSRLVVLVEDPDKACPNCPFRPDRRIELALTDERVKMFPDSLSLSVCGLGYATPPRFRIGGVHAMIGMPLVLTPVLP